MLKVACILHPTDLSENSKPAFYIACALARDYGARLVVLHVLERFAIPYTGDMAAPPLTLNPEEREAARQQLFHMKSPHDDVRVEHRIEEGETATVVLQVAKDIHCDLIVLGTHGRTGLTRVVMGSVAEKITRTAPCPVLTIRRPAAQ